MWIGVDFGTYKSCISYWKNGNHNILADDDNRYIINNIKINDNGLEICRYRTKTTVHSIKRILGLSNEICSRSTLDELMKFLFNIIIKTAEENLGEKITGFVIGIPDHYTQYQRKKLIGYGKELGINIRLIHDSTAAALTYQNKFQNNGNCEKVLIYNLGAGHVTASIVLIEDGMVGVSETLSDNIGADDCDYILAKHLSEKHNVTDTRELNYILSECKRIKHELSVTTNSIIEIGFDGKTEIITRDRFEEICGSCLLQCFKPVEKLLHHNKVDKIIMIGGGSRINYIKRSLTSLIGSTDKLCFSLNPEETIAIGASIHAGILNHDLSVPSNLLPINIVSDDIQAKCGDIVINVMDRNSHVPYCGHKCRYVLSSPIITIQETNTHNKLLMFNYKVTATNNPVELTCNVDIDGIVKIIANDSISGEQLEIIEEFY